jgi:hypothetical protein
VREINKLKDKSTVIFFFFERAKVLLKTAQGVLKEYKETG